MGQASNFKGAMLEYMVRRILLNCGFTNVKADGLYMFECGNLFYINGKGAAHDADVLVNPPFQVPFSYPTRLLFECKFYKNNISLNILRGALGLRNDINDFEVVTRDSLLQRQTNRRNEYAIENRTRSFYQVGIASVYDFTNSAYEFAANNKIPLFSLKKYFGEAFIKKLELITDNYIDNHKEILNLVAFFKVRNKSYYSYHFYENNFLIEKDELLHSIFSQFEERLKTTFIGVLESGDLIFLQSEGEIINFDFFNYKEVIGKLFYFVDSKAKWMLEFVAGNIKYKFEFYIPTSILNQWYNFSLSKESGIELKRSFFSNFYLFGSSGQYITVNLDKRWLSQIENAESQPEY